MTQGETRVGRGRSYIVLSRLGGGDSVTGTHPCQKAATLKTYEARYRATSASVRHTFNDGDVGPVKHANNPPESESESSQSGYAKRYMHGYSIP